MGESPPADQSGGPDLTQPAGGVDTLLDPFLEGADQ
jgi:hypothetical protein